MIYLTELNEGLPTERVLNYRISTDYAYRYTDEEIKQNKPKDYYPTGFTIEAVMDAYKPSNQSERINLFKQVAIPISKTYKTKSEAEQKLKEIIKDINDSLNQLPVKSFDEYMKDQLKETVLDPDYIVDEDKGTITLLKPLPSEEFLDDLVVNIPFEMIQNLGFNDVKQVNELIEKPEIRRILSKRGLDLSKEIVANIALKAVNFRYKETI